MEIIYSSGKQFVSIGLMSYIPDYSVFWGIEDIVQGYSQFYHAKAGGQMSPSFCHGFYDLAAYFRSKLNKLLGLEVFYVLGTFYRFKQT